jgi:hypothetical protein
VLAAWALRSAEVAAFLECPYPCCKGKSIVRFEDPLLATELEIHNITSTSEVLHRHSEVIERAPRIDAFRSLCANAYFHHEWLVDKVPAARPSRQLKAWIDALAL